jgi:hypothetical protein
LSPLSFLCFHFLLSPFLSFSYPLRIPRETRASKESDDKSCALQGHVLVSASIPPDATGSHGDCFAYNSPFAKIFRDPPSRISLFLSFCSYGMRAGSLLVCRCGKFGLERVRAVSMQKFIVTMCLVLGWVCAGCEQTEAIRHYRVPKSLAADAPSPPSPGAVQDVSQQRMLAALVLQADRAWFFKTMGPESPLSEQAEAFRALVKSVRFADGKPQWNLPAGWRQKGESGMRFATLEFGSAENPLELTVIPLPIPPGDRAVYVLSNVNRWRKQMNLDPIAAAELDRQSQKIELDGATAIVVDLRGSPPPTGMAGGAMTPQGGSVSAKPAKEGIQAASGSKLRFEVPAGWVAGEKVVSRGGITLRHEAAFSVVDGERRAEITVDRLPSGGGLLGNVNRWRQQIGLGPVNDAELQAGVKQLSVGGQSAPYVELIGEKETVLGLVADRSPEAWYIKFKGDKELAERQKPSFQSFIASIRLD